MQLKGLSQLFWIKALHTAIWIFYNVVIFYLLYAVCINRIDIWVCFDLIVFEVVVLFLFDMRCPLTLVAENYSKSRKANFDIFLPNWLAKYNKQIYTVIILITLAILIYRLFTNS